MSDLVRRRLLQLAAIIAICLATGSGTRAYAQEATIGLPPGFAIETIADGLNLPTDMVFLPSGDILVAEKGTGSDDRARARIRLVRDGVTQSVPVLTLSVNAHWDSGIQGIIIDPDFETNHFFYLWYSTGENALGWHGSTMNRLSRFVFDPGTGTADPAGETMLLDNVPWSHWHNGGGLYFDREGYLYIAIGDTGVSMNAQDLSSLNGKILRLHLTENGAKIPADNPFVQTPGARPEIFALGLRNPFRIAEDRTTGLLYVIDVGDTVWEEVNVLKAGANYGWPLREGPCSHAQQTPCEVASSIYTDPVIYYPHGQISNAVTGIAIYTGNGFSAHYPHHFFLADFNDQVIRVAALQDDGFQLSTFADNAGSVVDLEARPEGLYLLDIYSGEIRWIYYGDGLNQIPLARLTADPLRGAAPLTVTFSAEGSSNVDGGVFRWNFGDGTPLLVTAQPVITHTYAVDGVYDAFLQLIDGQGTESARAKERITVYSGEFPEIRLENLTAPARTEFHGGDIFQYSVVRSSGTQGLHAETPFIWNIDFHHNQHVHPLVTHEAAAEGEFVIPRDNHGGAFNIAYQFRLTMVTETGQEIEVKQMIAPAVVQVRLDSEPAALYPGIQVDGLWQNTPTVFQAVVGTEYHLASREWLLYDNAFGHFSHWHVAPGWPRQDGLQPPYLLWEREPTVIIPEMDTDYIAYYRYDRSAERLLLPIICTLKSNCASYFVDPIEEKGVNKQ